MLIILMAISELSCYQCRQEVDDYNRTIRGDEGCFEGKDMEEYLLECPNGYEFCKTDLYVDWLPNGQHKYGMYRNCSEETVSKCLDGLSTVGKWKDCLTSCNTTGCNDGDEALDAFIETNPSNIWNCYACEAEFFLNGTVIGWDTHH